MAGFDGQRNSKHAEFVRSPVIQELADEGKLLIVGALHDVSTGKVSWYDSVSTPQ